MMVMDEKGLLLSHVLPGWKACQEALAYISEGTYRETCSVRPGHTCVLLRSPCGARSFGPEGLQLGCL